MKKYYILLIFIVTLLNGCQKELSTSPEDILLAKNALIVESYPSGAGIYLNDKNTGQFTPDTLFWVNEGRIKLTLKLNLFKDSTITIQQSPIDTQRIFLDYSKNPTMNGRLFIDSNPRDAEIFLNDSSISQVTPHEVRGVFPGQYKVTLKRKGYWDEHRKATVYSSYTTNVYPKLVDTLTWVNYTTERSGIPSDYLTSLAIGPDGMKWMGTLDSGLVSFDDKKWTVYNSSNSVLPDDYVRNVHIDNSNIKWVGTNVGLVKIDGDNWSVFNTANSGIPDDRVTSIHHDGKKLWVGTENGLGIYDGSNWTAMSRENSILPANIVNNLWHNAPYMWVCTSNGILRISEFSSDTLYAILNDNNSGFPNNNVRDVAIDKTYRMWVACGKSGSTPGGTAQKIDREWLTYSGKPDANVYCIVVDNNNVKWFGSAENGLARFLYGQFTYYLKGNSGIGSERIVKVLIDSNGHKWLASLDGGLTKYKGN
jgi:hypothetical protein